MPKQLPTAIDHCWRCPYHHLIFKLHSVRVSEYEHEARVHCKLAPFHGIESSVVASVPGIEDTNAPIVYESIRKAASGTPAWCPLEGS